MATNDDQQMESNVLSAEGDYEQLLDDYSHFAPPAEGELLQGHVLKVTDKEVIVDFGYKSEGLVPIEQLIQSDGQVHVKAGDNIDVMVDRTGPKPEGYVLLSYQKANQTALARQQLERVLKINPNYPNAADVRKALSELRS